MKGEGLAKWGPVPLRLAIGLMFMAHGSQKLFGLFGGPGLGGVQQMVASLGFQPVWLWALLVAGSEFFGGLAVFLGCLTRLAVLPLLATMGVAFAKVHLPHGFFLQNGGFEYVFVITGGLVTLLVTGAGTLSVDAWRCCRTTETQKGKA